MAELYYIHRHYAHGLDTYCGRAYGQQVHIDGDLDDTEFVPLSAIAPLAQLIMDDPLGVDRYCQHLFDQREELLGNLIAYSQTPRAAIHATVEYSSLISNAMQMSLQNKADGSLVGSMRWIAEASELGQFLFDVTLGSGTMFLAEVLDQKGLLPAAAAGANDLSSLREALFHSNLMTLLTDNQEEVRIVYSRTMLDQRSPRADERLVRSIQSELDRHKRSLPNINNIREMAVVLLQQNLQAGVSADWLAEQLNMSRRSLSRHLREQGTSFQSLLDQQRRSRSEQLLRPASGKATLPLKQIAQMAGFKSISAFNQAFKKWTGQSPSQYQKQQ